MINTVAELIEKLKEFDPEEKVVIANNWGEVHEVVSVEKTDFLDDENWIPCVLISEY